MNIKLRVIVSTDNMEMMLKFSVSTGALVMHGFSRTSNVSNCCEMIVPLSMYVKKTDNVGYFVSSDALRKVVS